MYPAAEKGYSRKLGFRLEVFSETHPLQGPILSSICPTLLR
jgi:hypothetical protein